MQAEAGNIALVLLDINMPVMDGFEVLKAMNANHTIEDTPVIMISSEDSDAAIRRSYELGASDYVNRPFDARIVYRRVTNTIKLYAKQRQLVQMVSDQIRARENNTDTLVGVLSHIVEFRNGESGSHVRHIRIITEMLLHRLLEISSNYSITAEQQDLIPLASALHDIGKIGIDEKILNKPGKLTPEEFEVIQDPQYAGSQDAARSGWFCRAAAAANGLRDRPLAPRTLGWARLPGWAERAMRFPSAHNWSRWRMCTTR